MKWYLAVQAFLVLAKYTFAEGMPWAAVLVPTWIVLGFLSLLVVLFAFAVFLEVLEEVF